MFREVALLMMTFIEAIHSIGCRQLQTGSIFEEPVHLYSKGGSMNVHLYFKTGMNSDGTTECCFLTKDGARSPTLHLVPGGNLTLTVTNLGNPEWPLGGKTPTTMMDAMNDAGYNQQVMNGSINIHFHGMFVSPALGQDDVFMLISPGSTFTYHVPVAINHPPGVYWYHPHNHGYSEMTVLGGATGLIIVDGIEQSIPRLGDMPFRTLTFRDTARPISTRRSRSENHLELLDSGTRDVEPKLDVSLNYIPVKYPEYVPVQIPVRPAAREFWRIVNAGADSILDLQVLYDGVPQLLRIVALDGVPVQDPRGYVDKHSIFLPSSARAEVIIRGPNAAVKRAELVTLEVDGGPDAICMPRRPLALLALDDDLSTTLKMPSVKPFPIISPRMTVQQLIHASPNRLRHLYFSQEPSDPSNPKSSPNFYITVDGQPPKLFDPGEGPSIVTRQGEIEDWVIINKAREVHAFHIHQVHFIVLEVNGDPLPPEEVQLQDVYQTPYWKGVGEFPSIKVRMAFTEIDVGLFLYHCHTLNHEDSGMMATIQVLPAGAPLPSLETSNDQQPEKLTAILLGAAAVSVVGCAMSFSVMMTYRNRGRSAKACLDCGVKASPENQCDVVVSADLVAYVDTDFVAIQTFTSAC